MKLNRTAHHRVRWGSWAKDARHFCLELRIVDEWRICVFDLITGGQPTATRAIQPHLLHAVACQESGLLLVPNPDCVVTDLVTLQERDPVYPPIDFEDAPVGGFGACQAWLGWTADGNRFVVAWGIPGQAPGALTIHDAATQRLLGHASFAKAAVRPLKPSFEFTWSPAASHIVICADAQSDAERLEEESGVVALVEAHGPCEILKQACQIACSRATWSRCGRYLCVVSKGTPPLAAGEPGRKEGRFTHPWQPARLIGWNSVWVGQCDISAITSCQGRL